MMKDYGSTNEVVPLLHRTEGHLELSYQNKIRVLIDESQDEASSSSSSSSSSTSTFVYRVSLERRRPFPRHFIWALLAVYWVVGVGVLLAITGRRSPRLTNAGWISHEYLFSRSSSSASSCDRVRQSLESLDKRLQGRVVFPEENEFDAARKLFNVQYMQPPCAVVEPYSVKDVSLAVPVLVKLESQYGIRFSVKSGGQCFANWSSAPDGVMLSLSKLNAFSFTKPDSNSPSKMAVATLGPGTTIGDILKHALDEQGYAGVLGSASGVAMGGWILGGGFGYWSRLYGLGIDNLLEVQIVLADSSIVTASEREHPDLFWALRGAGQANFGVVTEYKYKLYPTQPEILQVTGQLSHVQAAQFFNTLGLDENKLPFNCHMEANSDVDSMTLFFACTGSSNQELYEGQAAISSLLHQTLPTEDARRFLYKKTTWLKAASEETAQFDGFSVQYWNGFLMKGDNNIQTWEKVVDALWEMCKGNKYVLMAVDLRGGAMAKVDSTATAFPWRGALYNIGVVVYVYSQEPRADTIFKQEVTRVNAIWTEKVAPYLQGTFPNFAMASLGEMPPLDAAQIAWDGNLLRLGQVKSKYDPFNAFHSALTIPFLNRPTESGDSPTQSPSNAPRIADYVNNDRRNDGTLSPTARERRVCASRARNLIQPPKDQY